MITGTQFIPTYPEVGCECGRVIDVETGEQGLRVCDSHWRELRAYLLELDSDATGAIARIERNAAIANTGCPYCGVDAGQPCKPRFHKARNHAAGRVLGCEVCVEVGGHLPDYAQGRSS